MRSVMRLNLPAVLAALALVLAGSACNALGNRPTESDSIIVVSAITVSGDSVSSTADTTATLSLTVESKDTSVTSGTFFSDVALTNYTVAYNPPGLVPDVTNGVITTGFTPIGGGATLILTMVPNGSKPAAGTVVAGSVHVEGHDFNGRALSFDVQVGILFTP